MSPERQAFEAALSSLGDRTPNSIEYQKLGDIALAHDLTPRLNKLDPFSPEYKETVMRIYHDLRGENRPYLPNRMNNPAWGYLTTL